MKIVCAVLLTLAAVSTAEPPSPNSRYLPPGQGGGQQGYNAPSSQYGAPSAPSSQYGTPSNQYSAPSSQYGAPQQTQAVFRSSPNFGGSKPSQNYGAPSSQYLPGNQGNQGYAGGKSGYGGGEDQYNEPANYQFEYMVKDEQSGNDFGHKESRQGEMTEGEYYVLLPDGRKQIVTYEADENGYRPKIKYEESQSGYGRGPANGGYSGGSNGGYSGGSNGGYSGGSNGGYSGGSNGGYSGGSNGGYSGGSKANGGY